MENQNRRNLSTVYIKAESEQELEAKLFELSIETLKAADVVAIYPRGSFVYAWVRVESKHVSIKAAPAIAPKKSTKKKAKKKVTK